jgi:hypothetical protein
MSKIERIFATDAESEECGPPESRYAAVFRDLAEIERQVRRLTMPEARRLLDRNQRGAVAAQARRTARVIEHIANCLDLEGLPDDDR